MVSDLGSLMVQSGQLGYQIWVLRMTTFDPFGTLSEPFWTRTMPNHGRQRHVLAKRVPKRCPKEGFTPISKE